MLVDLCGPVRIVGWRTEMGRLPKGAPHEDIALREQDDFGSGFDFTFVGHAGAGTGAGDGEVQIL